MVLEYTPKGVCPRKIYVQVEDGIVQNAEFVGGCDGNHKGLVSLIKGMPAENVIEKLEGITCGFRSTSCPDQLAQALKEVLK